MAVASWAFYGEKLSCVQVFGVLVVVGGIVLLGVFAPEKAASE